MPSVDPAKPEKLPLPEMPREYTLRRSVPDHELLLVFQGDEHASAFSDWLQEAGWDAFCEWAGSS